MMGKIAFFAAIIALCLGLIGTHQSLMGQCDPFAYPSIGKLPENGYKILCEEEDYIVIEKNGYIYTYWL